MIYKDISSQLHASGRKKKLTCDWSGWQHEQAECNERSDSSTRLLLVECASILFRTGCQWIQGVPAHTFCPLYFPRSVKGKAGVDYKCTRAAILFVWQRQWTRKITPHASTSWPCIERGLGRTVFSNSGCGKGTSCSRMGVLYEFI